MSRVGQLLLGLAASSAFYCGVVPALGLGEITLHSALNQPLEAEIELLQVADLTRSDLLQAPVPVQAADAALEDDFQLNLDDLSLDADCDLVSPFPAGMPGKSAASTSGVSASDDLPEVFASADARAARSPFAQSMLVEEASADDWLQENLAEDFLGQPLVDNSQRLHDFDQLATSEDNLARLNLALAYIDQGSLETACNILNQVIGDGDDEQKREARQLLAQIA